MRRIIRRCAIALAVWLPFFALWSLFAASFGQGQFSAVAVGSLISTGIAGLLGIAAWHVCQRRPWPLGFSLSFYLFQILFAGVYAAAWTTLIRALDFVRRGNAPQELVWSIVVRQFLTGVWFYAIFAGIAYAVQTRNRLHEKETLSLRAQALATAARLDALRARLNPHFLFNALHTLGALVKFRPEKAEDAIERLGDMLRYTLKEERQGLVEFSEEYEFTQQYIAFEQLRYEERLKVDVQIDPECFNFDLPPFSIQTLAENAVQHAISSRPEGGSIWIKCACQDGTMNVSVRDNGPGSSLRPGDSHHLGLRSLAERLQAGYGSWAKLRVYGSPEGFEATFVVPSLERLSAGSETHDKGFA